VVTIKNRPFTPYTDENGNYINVKYSFEWKAHFLEWDTPGRGFGYRNVDQSTSEYTVAIFPYGMRESSSNPPYTLGAFESGSLLDFRVQAQIGYFYRLDKYSDEWFYVGEVSEYAKQTVTIPTFDKPGTSTVKPPSTSNPNTPSTSDDNNSQQKPTLTNLLIILVSVCIITSLLMIIVYLLYSQQRKKRSAQIQSYSKLTLQ
jgi:hypothetical protein